MLTIVLKIIREIIVNFTIFISGSDSGKLLDYTSINGSIKPK